MQELYFAKEPYERTLFCNRALYKSLCLQKSPMKELCFAKEPYQRALLCRKNLQKIFVLQKSPIKYKRALFGKKTLEKNHIVLLDAYRRDVLLQMIPIEWMYIYIHMYMYMYIHMHT